MSTLENAIALAANAHAGQLDKQGLPYILHPLNVMMRLNDPTDRIVAVLHDTLEDTWVTAWDLTNRGYCDEIVDAVVALTHRKDEPYFEYIKRLSVNPRATRVKLADLAHNMELDRLPGLRDKDWQRYKKYRTARGLLQTAMEKNRG